jgi:hypothetical protein
LAELSGQTTIPLVLIGVPVIFALVGTAFLVLGLRSASALRRFRRTAQRAPGVVLDLVLDAAGPRGDRSWIYFPIVRYSLPDGRVVDFRSSQGSVPPAVRKGQQVTVLYDPADPSNARLEGVLSGGCLSSLFVVLGGAFILLGVAIAVSVLLVYRAVSP